MLSPNRALMVGIPTKVGESLNATGTGQTRPFSVLRPPSKDSKVICTTTGTFTVLNGNVEISSDGGTTYFQYSSFDYITTPVLILENISPGLLYRFNIGAITQSVTPDIMATLS